MAACSILLVPLIMVMMHKPTTINNFIGSVIKSMMSIGAFFMFLSAVVCSAYTIAVDKIAKEEDPLILIILQMWMCAILGFVFWLIEEPTTFASVEFNKGMLSSVLILAFFSKSYAYLALMYAQKYSDPISVTIIASTEPVVTLILAVLIPTAFEEQLTVTSVLGASVIMTGAIVSGIKFHSRKKVTES